MRLKNISFRLGMFAGFALILILLGSSAWSSWVMLERLAAQSRQGSEEAIEMMAAIQELGERTIDVERSASQYLILGDAAILEQFDETMNLSLVLVSRLESMGGHVLATQLADWRKLATSLRKGVREKLEQRRVGAQLDSLTALNDELERLGKRWIDGQNERLIDELEKRRLALGGQILLATAGALLVAVLMGWWLVRPVRQLEAAVIRLGASRFETAIDIDGPDDLQSLGQRLDWLRLRLAELESDRQRSLRHVSHELKTPLTALKEGVALLADEVPGPLEQRQREVVGILSHNVAALQKQIESLLTLNAAAFEGRRLNIERVELQSLLLGAAAERRLHLAARELELKLAYPPGFARMDREKVAVILDNLLSNAIDFSPDGSTIQLSVVRQDGKLRFECADAGPGVAPEDRERIFDPFVQGRNKAPSPRQGSGVGLSIVRELAAAMDGRVSLLESPVGANFCVEMPDDQ